MYVDSFYTGRALQNSPEQPYNLDNGGITMNHLYRARRYSDSSETYDTLFPQTITNNILRQNNGGVLEQYLNVYDHHVVDAGRHVISVTSTGTHRRLNATARGIVPSDGMLLLLTLHTDIDNNPTLNLNETGDIPIVDNYGEPVAGGYHKGHKILLSYSTTNSSWMMMSQDTSKDVTKIFLPSLM